LGNDSFHITMSVDPVVIKNEKNSLYAYVHIYLGLYLSMEFT